MLRRRHFPYIKCIDCKQTYYMTLILTLKNCHLYLETFLIISLLGCPKKLLGIDVCSLISPSSPNEQKNQMSIFQLNKSKTCKITDSKISVINRFGSLFKKLEKLSIFENCIMLKLAFIKLCNT